MSGHRPPSAALRTTTMRSRSEPRFNPSRYDRFEQPTHASSSARLAKRAFSAQPFDATRRPTVRWPPAPPREGRARPSSQSEYSPRQSSRSPARRSAPPPSTSPPLLPPPPSLRSLPNAPRSSPSARGAPRSSAASSNTPNKRTRSASNAPNDRNRRSRAQNDPTARRRGSASAPRSSQHHQHQHNHPDRHRRSQPPPQRGQSAAVKGGEPAEDGSSERKAAGPLAASTEQAASDNPLLSSQQTAAAALTAPSSGDTGAPLPRPPSVTGDDGKDASHHFLRLKMLLNKAVGSGETSPIEAFELFDTDFSGEIDAAKFHSGLGRLGVALSRAESDALLRRHFSPDHKIRYYKFINVLGINTPDFPKASGNAIAAEQQRQPSNASAAVEEPSGPPPKLNRGVDDKVDTRSSRNSKDSVRSDSTMRSILKKRSSFNMEGRTSRTSSRDNTTREPDGDAVLKGEGAEDAPERGSGGGGGGGGGGDGGGGDGDSNRSNAGGGDDGAGGGASGSLRNSQQESDKEGRRVRTHSGSSSTDKRDPDDPSRIEELKRKEDEYLIRRRAEKQQRAQERKERKEKKALEKQQKEDAKKAKSLAARGKKGGNEDGEGGEDGGGEDDEDDEDDDDDDEEAIIKRAKQKELDRKHRKAESLRLRNMVHKKYMDKIKVDGDGASIRADMDKKAESNDEDPTVQADSNGRARHLIPNLNKKLNNKKRR